MARPMTGNHTGRIVNPDKEVGGIAGPARARTIPVAAASTIPPAATAAIPSVAGIVQAIRAEAADTATMNSVVTVMTSTGPHVPAVIVLGRTIVTDVRIHERVVMMGIHDIVGTTVPRSIVTADTVTAAMAKALTGRMRSTVRSIVTTDMLKGVRMRSTDRSIVTTGGVPMIVVAAISIVLIDGMTDPMMIPMQRMETSDVIRSIVTSTANVARTVVAAIVAIVNVVSAAIVTIVVMTVRVIVVVTTIVVMTVRVIVVAASRKDAVGDSMMIAEAPRGVVSRTIAGVDTSGMTIAVMATGGTSTVTGVTSTATRNARNI